MVRIVGFLVGAQKHDHRGGEPMGQEEGLRQRKRRTAGTHLDLTALTKVKVHAVCTLEPHTSERAHSTAITCDPSMNNSTCTNGHGSKVIIRLPRVVGQS